MIDENLLNELNSFDWVKILKILTAYASFKTFGKNIPRSKEPQDYAQESVVKIYTGERAWNKKAYPDIIDCLKGVIDSLIYNDIHSQIQKLTNNLNESSDFDIEDPNINWGVLFESEQEIIQIKEEIQNAIKGDDNLEIFFMYLEENIKFEEFSQAFGIDINDVYNLSKRLRRIVRKILENRKKQ